MSCYFRAYIQLLNIYRTQGIFCEIPLQWKNGVNYWFVFTMTLCVWIQYHSAKSMEQAETKSIIFILAKHPTQRSHSKTHWIRIENLQTKHEAWGCFKLNNTPLYNKKWVLIFFPTWNYNQYIQKKNVYMQIFYRCQILLWYNKSI